MATESPSTILIVLVAAIVNEDAIPVDDAAGDTVHAAIVGALPHDDVDAATGVVLVIIETYAGEISEYIHDKGICIPTKIMAIQFVVQ